MTTRLKLILLLLCYSVTAAANDTPTPLRVGLLPFVSTEKLLQTFAPLKSYLEIQLSQPVVLITAPTYEDFFRRATQYQYDLYLTAPHFAALAETDYHYRRIAKVSLELKAMIVASKDSPIKTLKDLKGQKILAPSDIAAVSILGEQFLNKNKLYNGKNIVLDFTQSQNNTVLSIANGKAVAGIISLRIFQTTPPEIREKLTLLASSSAIPNVMFMASPKLSEKEFHRLRNAMLNFTAEGGGKEFFSSTGYGDLTKIQDKDMRQLQPLVKILRSRINKKMLDSVSPKSN